MTSYLFKSQEVARRRRPAEAQCTRSLGLGHKLCAVIPVAGQRTRRGTTFRVLKVTSQSIVTSSMSVCVFLSVRLSPELHFLQFSRVTYSQHIAAVRSSSGGVAVCYVLPVFG